MRPRPFEIVVPGLPEGLDSLHRLVDRRFDPHGGPPGGVRATGLTG